ncbi:hypothetical protein GWK47_022985 [Chionoecetes opilio]|uniref:Uncharacterized protein n=1 Tax=Chionoecetes opilio TaxID=41210 RepID=A0A8J4XRR1_CHIOP|nr:hypothetical protein GWK47_022985 [Chionoecetes opilio]
MGTPVKTSHHTQAELVTQLADTDQWQPGPVHERHSSVHCPGGQIQEILVKPYRFPEFSIHTQSTQRVVKSGDRGCGSRPETGSSGLGPTTGDHALLQSKKDMMDTLSTWQQEPLCNLWLIDKAPIDEITGARLPSKEQVLLRYYHHHREMRKTASGSRKAVVEEVLPFWSRAGIPTTTVIHAGRKLSKLVKAYNDLKKNKNKTGRNILPLKFLEWTLGVWRSRRARSIEHELRGESKPPRRSWNCGTRRYLRGWSCIGTENSSVLSGDTEDRIAVLLTGEDDAEFLLGSGKLGLDWQKRGCSGLEGGGRSGRQGQDHRLLFRHHGFEHWHGARCLHSD